MTVALRGGRAAARIPLESHAVGLVFLLLAVARSHGDIDWANPLAAILVAGVAAMAARRRGHPGPGAALRGSGPGGPRVVAGAPSEPRLDRHALAERHRAAAQPRAHHRRPVRRRTWNALTPPPDLQPADEPPRARRE